MRFLKYVVSLTTAAIAILGCATESGTPTPTATPLPASMSTPTPIVMPTPTPIPPTPEPPSDTSVASTQEIVVDLCSQPAEIRSFDVTTRTLSFENDVLVDALTVHTQISGHDYHVVITPDDGDVGEIMHVDGLLYSRESNTDWAFVDDRLYGAFLFISNESVCPNIEGTAASSISFTKVGDEIIDSILTTHFSDSGPKLYYIATPDPSQHPTTAETRDYWINPNGQLVQFKQVYDTPAGDWYPAHQRNEFTSKVYDVGEPNVIAEPEVP